MPAKKRIRRAQRAAKRRWPRPPASGVPRPLRGPSLKSVEGARPAPESQAEALKATTDFSKRYAYVLSDLKRAGALAGMLLLVLIILSLILR